MHQTHLVICLHARGEGHSDGCVFFMSVASSCDSFSSLSLRSTYLQASFCQRASVRNETHNRVDESRDESKKPRPDRPGVVEAKDICWGFGWFEGGGGYVSSSASAQGFLLPRSKPTALRVRVLVRINAVLCETVETATLSVVTVVATTTTSGFAAVTSVTVVPETGGLDVFEARVADSQGGFPGERNERTDKGACDGEADENADGTAKRMLTWSLLASAPREQSHEARLEGESVNLLLLLLLLDFAAPCSFRHRGDFEHAVQQYSSKTES